VTVAVVEEVTLDVATVNVALELPAGMATVAGTVAVGELLDKLTVIPPAGAAAVKLTVPVDELPPGTLAGFSVTELKAGAAGVVIESTAVLETPL
jgi:hypothetical protein